LDIKERGELVTIESALEEPARRLAAVRSRLSAWRGKWTRIRGLRDQEPT
jgi:hypothetical protein